MEDQFYVLLDNKECIIADSTDPSIIEDMSRNLVHEYLEKRLSSVYEEIKQMESAETVVINDYLNLHRLIEEIHTERKRAHNGCVHLGSEVVSVCKTVVSPVSIKSCKAYPHGMRLN